MRTLKELLPKGHRTEGKKSPTILDEKTIFYVARRIIREEYGLRGEENITPILFKEGMVYLSSRSSLWANEIWIERDRLMGKMNLLLGKEAITGIKMGRDQLQ